MLESDLDLCCVTSDGSVEPLRLGFQLGMRRKLAYRVLHLFVLWRKHDVVPLNVFEPLFSRELLLLLRTLAHVPQPPETTGRTPLPSLFRFGPSHSFLNYSQGKFAVYVFTRLLGEPHEEGSLLTGSRVHDTKCA